MDSQAAKITAEDGIEQSGSPARKAGLSRRGMIAGVVLVVVAAVILLYLLVGRGLLGHNASSAAHSASALSGSPIYVEAPEMTTNLDAGPHRLSFVKAQCRIEVHRAADQAAVMAAMPRITDMFETYLRVLRPEELRSNVGLFRLHESLLARAQIAVPDAAIDDILFEEMIVQ